MTSSGHESFPSILGGPTRAVEIGEETRVEEDCRDSNNEA